MNLRMFQQNVYSQNGEDGVLFEIFKRLGIFGKGTCVEFGAWDGVHLSNTHNLIRNFGWSGVLIEGDPQKYGALVHTQAGLPVECVCGVIGFSSNNSLDTVLGRLGRLDDYDLVSIDIDGNDYHVWEAMEGVLPKVVVIEFNPTIPADVHFVQPRDMNVQQGSSLKALVDLGWHKGYTLIHVTTCNAIFVRHDLVAKTDVFNNSIEALWTDRSLITQMFVLYDGTIKLVGSKRLPWHQMDMDEERMQMIPAAKRRFPGAL